MKDYRYELIDSYSDVKTHKTTNVYRKVKVNNVIESGHSSISRVFSLILIILLFVALFRILLGVENGNLTFTSFLHYLSSFEPISISWSIPSIDLGTDWGIFNFLLPIFNGIISVLNFGITFCGMVITALLFLFDIVKWIFVIA